MPWEAPLSTWLHLRDCHTGVAIEYVVPLAIKPMTICV